MIRKIIFTLVWTAVFSFGSAMILGFFSGIFFFIMASNGHERQEDGTFVKAIALSWLFVPMILGPVGLVLGIMGTLPGTHLPPEGQGKAAQ